MEIQNYIQEYINNFRRHIANRLKPGIGLACTVHPVKGEGAVLEFKIGPNIKNEDVFEPTQESVNAVLKVIPQNMVGGNLDAIRFSGTNISMDPNRILLIKGENDPSLWTDEGAENDVLRILGDHTRARK
jgi:hypothetical protein